jgi:hypothetical protein
VEKEKGERRKEKGERRKEKEKTRNFLRRLALTKNGHWRSLFSNNRDTKLFTHFFAKIIVQFIVAGYSYTLISRIIDKYGMLTPFAI